MGKYVSITIIVYSIHIATGEAKMGWQDLVFTVGLAFIVLNTLPMFRMTERPPLSTSIPLGVIQLAFVAPQLSYGNYLSAILTALAALEWLVLAYLRATKR